MTTAFTIVLKTIKKYKELPYVIAVDSEYWNNHIVGYRGDITKYDQGMFAYQNKTDDYKTICEKQRFSGFYVEFVNIYNLKEKYGVDYMPINSYSYSSIFNTCSIEEEFNIETMEQCRNVGSLF